MLARRGFLFGSKHQFIVNIPKNKDNFPIIFLHLPFQSFFWQSSNIVLQFLKLFTVLVLDSFKPVSYIRNCVAITFTLLKQLVMRLLAFELLSCLPRNCPLKFQRLFLQHEEEPAQNMKSQELSGAALKNKKKREAKARGGENTQQQIAVNILFHLAVVNFMKLMGCTRRCKIYSL